MIVTRGLGSLLVTRGYGVAFVAEAICHFVARVRVFAFIARERC